MPRAKQKPPDGALYVEDVETPNNFVMVPFMIADDLKPYDLAVYIQIRRRASERPGGACFRSNHGLAKDVGCSVSQVKKSRAVLEERGLIKVTYQRDENGIINAPPVVTIVSVWAENYRRYTKGDNRNHPGDIVTTPGDIVAAGRLPTDTKEESVEQEPSKKKKKDANASSVPEPLKAKTPKADASGEKPATGRTAEKNALFDEIVRVFKYDPKRLTKSERSSTGKAAYELLDAGYRPEHVRIIYGYMTRTRTKAFNPAVMPYDASAAIADFKERYGYDPITTVLEVDAAAEGTPPQPDEDAPVDESTLIDATAAFEELGRAISGNRIAAAGKR